MNRFQELFRFSKVCNVIGMIHIGPLPGTPRYEGSIAKLVDCACKEAENYKKCGIILAAANKEAVAVALAAGLQFIRAEGFIFSHVADEGWTDACAGDLLRYRHYLGAHSIAVFTDIKKKHSAHSITSDISIEDTVKAAEFFLSDGIILTGSTTGDPVNSTEFSKAKHVAKGPILIGSGVTQQNLAQYATANALIIGSYFKKDGFWMNEIDSDKIYYFMEKVHELRN